MVTMLSNKLACQHYPYQNPYGFSHFYFSSNGKFNLVIYVEFKLALHKQNNLKKKNKVPDFDMLALLMYLILHFSTAPSHL